MYLIPNDFLKSIQATQLTQLQTGDPNVLDDFITMSEGEARSHLVHKYLIDLEMTDTDVYSNAVTTYSAGSRVYTNTGGNIVMYYGKYPNPLFNLYGTYAINDLVFYNGHNWKALKASSAVYPESQHSAYYPNVFPTTENNTYWQDMGAYLIPVNTPVNNATYWVQGDNRDSQLVGYLCDIVLYHIHQRLAPNNIPALREHRYMGKPEDRAVKNGTIFHPDYCALGWLQGCATGRLTPNLAVIQPNQGRRIRRGNPFALPQNFHY